MSYRTHWPQALSPRSDTLATFTIVPNVCLASTQGTKCVRLIHSVRYISGTVGSPKKKTPSFQQTSCQLSNTNRMHRGTDYIYSYSDNRRRRPEEPSPLLPAFNPGQPIFVPGSPPKRHRPTVPIYATPESSRHYQTPSFASPERSNPNPGPSIFKTPERKEYSSNFLTPLSSHVCNDGLSMYTPEHKSKLVLSPSRRGPYSTASVVSSPVRNRAREASPVRRGESSHTRDRDDSDYSIYSDLKLRQAVYVRQFEFDKVNDETIWTTWQNGTILRSHVQMAYVRIL